MGNFGPRGLAACAVPLPLGWCTGLAASAVDLLHLAFYSKPKLLSLDGDYEIHGVVQVDEDLCLHGMAAALSRGG